MDASILSDGDVFSECALCPEMVVVPAGTFVMGRDGDFLRTPAPNPARKVTVPRFAMGRFEVTFEQWDACVADGGCSHSPDDEGWGRGRRPVMNVSWEDARAYADWLSGTTGARYRLPSEAEWEYAARAGSTGDWTTGDHIRPDQANFDGTGPLNENDATPIYHRRTMPVGSYPPNAFGLYDVHGNVSEMTRDCFNETYHGAPSDGSARLDGDCGAGISRGGSWSGYPMELVLYRRWLAVSNNPHDNGGFRVARDIDD